MKGFKFPEPKGRVIHQEGDAAAAWFQTQVKEFGAQILRLALDQDDREDESFSSVVAAACANVLGIIAAKLHQAGSKVKLNDLCHEVTKQMKATYALYRDSTEQQFVGPKMVVRT